MLLIRYFEQAVLRLFEQGHVNGTTHTCLGQEYLPVAVEPLLRHDDFVLSNHRSHGHFLARFDDPEALLAEIMGREGGVCCGHGGSQHLLRETFLSTGVQGQSLPVAVGIALHRSRAGRRQLAAAWIGDGTWGEGSVYEALNMASLWRVPLLVLVENNGIAQSTPTAKTMAGTIRGRCQAFDIEHLLVEGDDVEQIRSQVAPFVERVRTGRPAVVEFRTVRVGPHSKGDDARSVRDQLEAAARDWFPRYRLACGDRFNRIDRRQRERISHVVADVCARPHVGPMTMRTTITEE